MQILSLPVEVELRLEFQMHSEEAEDLISLLPEHLRQPAL